MHAFTLEKAFDLTTDSPRPTTRFVLEQQEQQLAAEIEELARLRFSIVLTAKWEASPNENAERRAELRAELRELRHCYEDKIDFIAMTFGVEHAMKANRQVEGGITRALREELVETANFMEMPDTGSGI
jgi:hypothetical protein